MVRPLFPLELVNLSKCQSGYKATTRLIFFLQLFFEKILLLLSASEAILTWNGIHLFAFSLDAVFIFYEPPLCYRLYCYS